MNNSHSTMESPLQRERLMFNELLTRLIDAILNRAFDLNPKKSRNRLNYIVFLFLISGFVISMFVTSNTNSPILPTYSLSDWVSHTQNLFWFLLNPDFAQQTLSAGRNYINEFVSFAGNAISDPRTLQYLPIILASFFIAQHFAALYLADIFEIDDISVARNFIIEVALTGSDDTIRISKGEILEEHRSSPNFLIGGPGKVLVDLDSVALFEKPDGTPHVIGPTGKEKGGKAAIDGFERFRQAVDVRDHYVELRDQDIKSLSVKGRSQDGIPITATDVRLMFSIYRGDDPQPIPEAPYPFDKAAVERIVYKSGSRVTPDQVNPSAFEFSWINNMIGLIRGRLGRFMSERSLTEYLASIGVPEFEKLNQQEELIAEQAKQLTRFFDDDYINERPKPAPKLHLKFTPRHQISNLFSEFADEFTKNSRDNGVELHWIGVGTWKTPLEIDVVSEKHLEAWQLSQENAKNGSQEAMNNVASEAILNKVVALIHDVPIYSYEKVRNIDDKKNAIRALLLDYRQQLIETAEYAKEKGEAISPNMQQAIAHVDDILGLHWVGLS